MKKRLVISAAVLGGAAVLVYSIWAARHVREIRHIMLISIDTCRADHLGCYGYPKETTPNIDVFAQTATRFEHVVSPAPITLPAHSSMLTGTIPPFHGVHNNIGYQLAPVNVTLAELLQQNGFKTGAIVSTVVLDKQFGLNQGFDTYDDSIKNAADHACGEERPGDESTQLALDWLDKNVEGKFFLFLHYYDAHAKYEPPEPFASEFAGDAYAGEIAFVDHCIGQVIQKLKELNMYDSTLLIVTGDHGEMLGEHGEAEHTYFIYESAIKVPLLIKLPGQKNAGTVAQPVGLVDIVPTICSLLDIDLPAPVQGRDISPFLAGNIPDSYERTLYSESIVPMRLNASSLMAISTGQWKYIQAPRPELYDVFTDPAEEHNLVAQEAQRARILEDKLQETLEQSVRTDMDNSISLDAESIKRLESLGYVAGKTEGTIIFDENQDDPKDFIQVFEHYLEAAKLLNKKEYDQAKQILLDLMVKRPEFLEVYKQLGNIAVEQGDFDQSVQYYRQVVALDSAEYETDVRNNLAWIQATRPSLASRDVNEALSVAKRLCKKTHYSEPNSLDTLAVCQAALGDFSKAKKIARRAIILARAAQDPELAQKIDERRKLFEQSKPYIEE